jgi:pimeloyl-ACP methyl ester carboxylesterase
MDETAPPCNSLGGHVALAVALEHPDRVSALIPTGLSGLFERGFTRGVPYLPSWILIEIIGRTRHFVNAFGENVIVEEVERALCDACRGPAPMSRSSPSLRATRRPASHAAVTTG